ncbi:MAG: VWA domain-containing protein [Candidatus Thorarchaeota archaeon]
MVIRDRNKEEIIKKSEKNSVSSNDKSDDIKASNTIDYITKASFNGKDEFASDFSIIDTDEEMEITESDEKSSALNIFRDPPKLSEIAESDQLYLSVIIDYGLIGAAKLSPIDAEKMKIQTGNLIKIQDEEGKHKYKTRAIIDYNVEVGTIHCDGSLHVFSDISSEKAVVEKIANSTIIHPDRISLTIKTSNTDTFTVVSELRKNTKILRDFLSNYVLYNNLKIHWKEKELLLRINEIQSLNSPDKVAILDLASTCLLSIRPEGLVPFNAILLMDNSKSMNGKDLEVKNIKTVVQQLKDVFGNVLLTDFLKEFHEGVFIKRKSAATFASLMFLSEKVRRGLDETVSIITFADDAEILRVNGKPYVNSTTRTRETMKLAEQILENTDEKFGAGTNMASAVDQCEKIIEALPRNKKRNPFLVILLTDGFDTSKRIKESVLKMLNTGYNIVLYAVGIGPFVNRKELEEISKISGGEFFIPEDLNELIEWYRALARDLSVQLGEFDF